MKHIPVINLKDFEQGDEARSNLVKTVGQAFHDIGFVFLRIPEIQSVLEPVFEQFKNLFDLSEDIKKKYARPDIHYQRGWLPYYSETGAECRKAGADEKGLPDAKEGWFTGSPTMSPQHPLVERFPAAYPANVWPSEAPEFRDANEELYERLFTYGRGLLRVLAVYLEQPEDYFEQMVIDSPTVLRAIHYLRVAPEEVGNTVWACKHTDINLITVLPGSTRKGLWIKRRDGQWIPGTAPEGCVIVQVGDMLQYVTGGHFLSAWHEVRAPDHSTEKGRISAALFIHARSDFLFEPFVDESQKEEYPAITSYEILIKRLRDLGLYTGDN